MTDNSRIQMKHVFSPLVVSLISNWAMSQAPCLIASYSFDGNANDTTGNGHDGAVFGAVLAADRFGNANSAYYFDGSDDYIQLAGSWTGLDGTITAWIQPDALSQYNPIFSRRDTTVNGSALELVVNENVPPDSSKLYKGTDFRECASSGDLYFRNSTIEIQSGTWTCVAMTSDAVETKLFINGLEVVTYGDTDPGYWFENMCPGNINTYIGKLSRPLNTEYFVGRIDDVCVFDCALTAAEVSSLCALGTSTAPTRPRHEVSVYPNPTSGYLTITGVNSATGTTFELIDSFGRLLTSRSTDLSPGALQLDLSDLPNGLYTLLYCGTTLRVMKHD